MNLFGDTSQVWKSLPRVPDAIKRASLGQVLPGVWITAIHSQDLDAYVEHFRDREFHERTLRIPFPYTADDARAWMRSVSSDRQGRPDHFAIREQGGLLIGGLGWVQPPSCGQAELGYWLAKPLWGQGIMTECVRRLKVYAFEELRLKQLSATVLTSNRASVRVLEKNGFHRQTLLPGHYRNEDQFFDGELYACSSSSS